MLDHPGLQGKCLPSYVYIVYYILYIIYYIYYTLYIIYNIYLLYIIHYILYILCFALYIIYYIIYIYVCVYVFFPLGTVQENSELLRSDMPWGKLTYVNVKRLGVCQYFKDAAQTTFCRSFYLLTCALVHQNP